MFPSFGDLDLVLGIYRSSTQLDRPPVEARYRRYAKPLVPCSVVCSRWQVSSDEWDTCIYSTLDLTEHGMSPQLEARSCRSEDGTPSLDSTGSNRRTKVVVADPRFTGESQDSRQGQVYKYNSWIYTEERLVTSGIVAANRRSSSTQNCVGCYIRQTVEGRSKVAKTIATHYPTFWTCMTAGSPKTKTKILNRRRPHLIGFELAMAGNETLLL